MSDRVLVTGAAGFIGRHLVETLATERDDEIVATDIEASPPERFRSLVGSRIHYETGDVTDKQFLEELLAEDFDRVYHLAAVVGVDQYLKNPLRITDVNVIATRNLLDQLRDTGCRFVFTSTSEVYGKNPDVPWDEETDRVLGPATIDRWSYSTGKSTCEHMIHGLAASESPLTATVVRPFNLYGPGQRPKFVLPAFVKEVVNGDVPVVYDGGDQTRCFTFIDDFVEGLVRASTTGAGENEVFNLGATRETQIRELADLVLEIAGEESREPEHVDTKELYGEAYEDLDRRVPDITKAENELGWTAQTDLEAGIEAVIEWERRHY